MDQLKLFLDQVKSFLPESRIGLDELTCSIYARDASLYRVVPKAVLEVENESEMCKVIKLAHETKTVLGFRAAGTSLSGQALTEGVLLIQGKGWRKAEVLNEGEAIRCEPGLRGSEVNAYLKPYHRKIGPDPASIDAAKIGGIAANNASGMCCGVQNNTYKTTQAMKWIGSDGTLLDTSSEESRQNFFDKQPNLLNGIKAIAEEIQSQPELVELIQQKYLIKNTTGYAMNAFLDYHDPIDLITHLLIGSEGTLGFISEITYKTVREYPFKSNALVFFESMETACLAVMELESGSAKAIELMDELALISVEDQLPKGSRISKGGAALLIDHHADSQDELEQEIELTLSTLKSYHVESNFTKNDFTYASLWKIRKGMFPSVAAMRKKGETVIIEDIAFPLKDLAEATLATQKLFLEYGYNDAIIFGHARDGNLHVVFNQSFQATSEVDRYRKLMEALSELVTKKYSGSLKAEHGTGRNMAPFVKDEWGPKIYEYMKRIKELFDPKKLLNPDVLISSDPELHLKNFKPLPSVHDEIDACMECGFCERVCPSKDLSLTPRQRIAALREMEIQADPSKLEKQFSYKGDETCATDGMCSTVCPVQIDTGKMIKIFRKKKRSSGAKFIASLISKNQALFESASRIGLSVYHFLLKLEINPLPLLPGKLPKPAKRVYLTNSPKSDKKVVYYKSCMQRVFSKDPEAHKSLDLSLESLAMKAGYELLTLNKPGNCCGLPYSSKGFDEVASNSQESVKSQLLKISDNGKWPIIVDNSPCTQQLNNNEISPLKVIDSVEWLEKDVLPHLNIVKKEDSLYLHESCSSKKMELDSHFKKIAEALTDRLISSKTISCCGFAGDKGIHQPELNASALSSLKETMGENCGQGVSNSRTCEIGLSWHSDKSFVHIAQKLDQNSSSK